MSFHLEELGLSELQSFQKLYTQDWPKYCQEFYCLDNFIKFLKADPHIKHLRAYTLTAKRAKDEALFLILDRYQLFVGSLNNTNGLMEQALRLLDWSLGLKCSAIPFRHAQAVQNVVQEKKLKMVFNNLTNVYHMTAQDALKLKVEPPEGFYLTSLSEQDAQVISDEWPYRHLGSLYLIQRQIRLAVSAGLYKKDTQELVAWCIRSQGGDLGALQVKSIYQRRGFGSLITREISRRIAALGHDVIALVTLTNSPSLGLFDRLGFQVIDKAIWLRTEPIQGVFIWPEGE